MQKRSLNELINLDDPAWPLVQQWIAEAQNDVEVLPADRSQGEEVLWQLQITTRSPMGAIALESGGILVDHGWLRFLGSGHERMRGNLYTWNIHEEESGDDLRKGALIVAHDAVGGFFALNGGDFPGKPGTVFYFAPDALQWESIDMSYSALLNWALSGDLGLFYENMRWPGWEHDIASLSSDQGICIFPFLFSQGPSIAERSRRPVPMKELWSLQLDLAQQFQDLPDGTSLSIEIEE